VTRVATIKASNQELRIARSVYVLMCHYDKYVSGALSIPGWDDLSEELREGYVKAIRIVYAKRSLTPMQVHEEWRHSLEAQGWRYGLGKNYALKLHPYLLPYNSLPKHVRQKNELFHVAVALALGL